jgi:hypothetical protein
MYQEPGVIASYDAAEVLGEVIGSGSCHRHES